MGTHQRNDLKETIVPRLQVSQERFHCPQIFVIVQVQQISERCFSFTYSHEKLCPRIYNQRSSLISTYLTTVLIFH